MIKPATLQSEKVPKFEDSKSAFNIIASASQEPVGASIDDAKFTVPTCISLNLENLKCFETVEHQYAHWGVIFHNSLAIQPSNPAFPSHSGLTVLMGSPKNGFLEATFSRPVNWVSALVTSSQRLVISAYDQEGQLLNQSVLPTANLANSDSTIAPNTLLSVTGKNIKSVTFCAFDGQFTLDNFRFCV
jgi:hypothetical protein